MYWGMPGMKGDSKSVNRANPDLISLSIAKLSSETDCDAMATFWRRRFAVDSGIVLPESLTKK
jgi:hypothetical protein